MIPNMSPNNHWIFTFLVDFPFNASEKAKGEPWTREDPANLTKSVLDLVIISQELYQYVDEFSIDNQKKITPFKVGKNCSLSFTDHKSQQHEFSIPSNDECNIDSRQGLVCPDLESTE